jgi:hypothetical protein
MSLTVDLKCGRCLESHSELELQELTHPADTGRGIIFTHWAPCPTNGEPILYAYPIKRPRPLEQGKEQE